MKRLLAGCVMAAAIVSGCQSEAPVDYKRPSPWLGKPPASSRSDSPKPANTRPREELLSIIDDGWDSNNTLQINRFRNLLDQLDEKFPEDRKGIADFTVWATEQCAKDGVKVTCLDLMEGFNRQPARLKYQEWCIAYTVLRKKGFSHQESVDAIPAAIPKR